MNADNNLPDNNLAATLFGKTRRHLLALLYGRPGEKFYLRQLTAAAGVAVGAAQRELAELTAAGIISRQAEGRQVYFRANIACPVFAELQAILRKTAEASPARTAPSLLPPTHAASPHRTASAPSPARTTWRPNPAFVWDTRR